MSIVNDDGRGRRVPADARAAAETPLLFNALKTLAVVYILSVVSWGLATLHLPLELHVPIFAGALLAFIFGIAIYGLPQHRHPRFGYANLVTALRAGMVSFVGAVVLFSPSFSQDINLLAWSIAGLVVFVLSLDGVDGYLARRFRQQSAFGARFDMEIDALLILILSISAFVLNKAGMWVLLCGLLRYGFIVAQWLLPALRAELFPSNRRKAICVLQVAALLVVMVPAVAQPWSTIICATSLLLLTYSFVVDTAWLLRKGARA